MRFVYIIPSLLCVLYIMKVVIVVVGCFFFFFHIHIIPPKQRNVNYFIFMRTKGDCYWPFVAF